MTNLLRGTNNSDHPYHSQRAQLYIGGSFLCLQRRTENHALADGRNGSEGGRSLLTSTEFSVINAANDGVKQSSRAGHCDKFWERHS